jgi:hypothetical protein
MTRKIVLGTLLVGLIGVLVAGAIIRTVDKTENIAEARGLGTGRGGNEAVEVTQGNREQARAGNGQGRLQTENDLGRQFPNYEEPPDEWTEYEGTVVQTPADGGELVLETADGEQLTVGTGPGYMTDQGFSVAVGERITVRGYWEDGELKASQLTRVRDGETIKLRDELGRPAWAGSGRRGQERSTGTGSGYNSEGQGRGFGRQAGGGGGQPSGALGAGETSGLSGQGMASVDGWLDVPGTVLGVDTSALVVGSQEGEIAVENRAWWFAQDQGFTAQVGDRLTLRGFFEGDDFEVGSIVNHTSDKIVRIREEGGRPLWAGGGRRVR